uniref:DDT domain-containing protein n=1 Tax=Megaselia scalaris TaxID=36166 RepID=T1GSG8_MEGSC
MDVSTDSESLAAESGLSESESEDSQLFNISDLRVPLELGWKRETIIRGLTKTGQIKGESPSKLTRDNFSFSSKAIIGSFLQPAPPQYANDGEFIRMTDTEVAKRLEDLKMYTRHNMLGVEQRIEIAKQQQAMRDAKKMAKDDLGRSSKSSSRSDNKQDKVDTSRKDKDIKNIQAMEARRKRQEELDRIKQEDSMKRQNEKEKKRQEAMLLKEQELNKQKELLAAVETERERRRQHMALIRQLEVRRKFEDKERKKHQLVLDRLIAREKRVANKKRDTEILTQIRKPNEDSEIADQIDMPELKRLAGCKIPGQAMADLLMVFEFLHNFGETLGFDMESLPTLQNLHDALVSESTVDAEEELLSVMTHLLVCAIEDPGIPNPGRHTTLLGQSLRNADITNANVSEVLRIYLYATATGEVRQMTNITLDREKDRRIPDHHQNDLDSSLTSSKNQQYYELLHENDTWKLSICLKDRPFVALNPTKKAKILAHLCNDLLMNKAVLKQIDGSLESSAQAKKEKYMTDMKIHIDDVDLSTPYPLNEDNVDTEDYKFILPDEPNDWNPKVSKRVELALLEQLEALEDKIASASMQVKHWVLPTRSENESTNPDDVLNEDNPISIISLIRERIASLEGAIERRYLKPPLDWWSMAQLAAQDYFSRLQASGMGQFAHPDLAAAFPGGLAGLGNLGSTGGAGGNNMNNNSSKSNSKSSRKDKRPSSSSSSSNMSNALNSNNNLNSAAANILGLGSGTTITPTSSSSSGNGNSSYKSTLSNTSFGKSNNSSSISGTSSNVGNMGNENPTHSAAYNPVNLHKELLAIQAAAASAASKKPSHSSGSGNNTGIVQSSSKDKNGSANASLNSLNSLSQFSSLGLNSQQSMQAAMNALAAKNEIPVNNIPQLLPPATPSTTFEDSPTKSNSVDTPIKKILEDCSYQNGSTSKAPPRTVGDDAASTDVGMDEDLSDVESELTNVEEDEDSRLSAEEIQKKLEKMIKSSIQCKEQLEASSNQLRATCFGQDRFWRRYWKLPKAGGIFIEAMESAQNEIMSYNKELEDIAIEQSNVTIKSEIKTELNNDNNDEPNANEQCNEDVDPPAQNENNVVEYDEDEAKNDSGIEENDKLDDDVVVCDKSTNTKESTTAAAALTTVSSSVAETIESVVKKDDIELVNTTKLSDSKWFSVLNRELPLVTNELQMEISDIQKQYSNLTCDMPIQLQGTDGILQTMHNILHDHSSLLGVRLPPDTDIIKYTSSIVGPKTPGTTNRGRKKTISLDPNPLLSFPGISPAKKPRRDDYPGISSSSGSTSSSSPYRRSDGNSSSSDRVEVIKLPPTITSNGAYNLSSKKHEEQDMSTLVNLSMKSSGSNSVTASEEFDAPLNLSMKPESKSSGDFSTSSGAGVNSLQSLTSITAALGSGGNDKPHTGFKEGRPRNLGRGVSKPKKNTVASLLAQSRAVGMKPITAQQLLQQGTDLSLYL